MEESLWRPSVTPAEAGVTCGVGGGGRPAGPRCLLACCDDVAGGWEAEPVPCPEAFTELAKSLNGKNLLDCRDLRASPTPVGVIFMIEKENTIANKSWHRTKVRGGRCVESTCTLSTVFWKGNTGQRRSTSLYEGEG